MPTIVITGGHHNSALAVAQEFIKLNTQVIWLGHRHTSREDRNDSAEYLEVTGAGIKFYDLQAGRGVMSLNELWRIPLGFFHARAILRQIRPDAVLTFGSYLGAATGLAAASLGIPLYLHEQTVVAGRANQLIGRIAKKIYLTWDSSLKYFPHHKSQVVGLPIRPGLLTAKKAQLFPNALPTILVLGGKQGSQIINQYIFQCLPELLKNYNVIHQTGTSSRTGDYQKALSLKKSNYRPHGYIGEVELGRYLASIDLVVSRSGAHITYELAVLGIPSVLIPYPYTHQSEQLQNASFLVKSKIATVLPQKELSRTRLLSAITVASRFKRNPINLSRSATHTIVTEILADFK